MISRLFLLFLLFSLTAYASETVKIGVLAKRSPEITIAKWSPTAAYLDRAIEGYRFEIVPLSFEALANSVENDEIDFVLTNTMFYVELEYLYGISRIATLKNVSSRGDMLTSFGGVIVTKKENRVYVLKDLKDKRFGAVDSNSFGGWVMAQKELSDHGVTLEDFSDFRFFGSHDAVVMALNNGEIDAGTIRTDTLEQMTKEGSINLNDYRIIAEKKYEGFPFKVSTELYPEWPFAKLSSTPEALAVKVVSALLAMPADSDAARASQTAGWTIPLDYTRVHNVLDELHLFHHMESERLTFADFYEKYKIWFYGFIIGLLSIFSVLLYIFRLNGRLTENKIQIESLIVGLEEKVHERTAELEHLYAKEKYLKNILNTTSKVNEMLVISLSISEVTRKSLLQLVKHGPYRFALIGLTDENLLETASCSNDTDDTAYLNQYPLDQLKESTVFSAVKRTLEGNIPIIERLPAGYNCDIAQERYGCSLCWMISLPLKVSEYEKPIGNLLILSERDEGFEVEEVRSLEKLAIDIGMTINSIRQRDALELMEKQKMANYEETILAFVNIIEQRDSYTAGHTIRVARYCRLIAEAMHLPKEQIVTLEKAAILHDIGKVVTPDAILLKPGKLTELEYELIKQHSDAGFQMLSQIDMYKDLADIIYFHHVHYDGTGYPALPEYDADSVQLLSYIMAVADAFDAMTTNRIYKASKSIDEAVKEIARCSGTQFHPEVSVAAVEALSHVSVVETTQLPDNTLEHHRFSYFFLDALTDLYNENYLKTILSKKDRQHGQLTLIQLKRFSDYNQKVGWNAGNRFLKSFGALLKETYPQAMVFRYHGDGFVMLFDYITEISPEEFSSLPLLKENNMEVGLRHFDLKKGIPVL